MYLVLSVPNDREPAMSVVSPRLITLSARLALDTARKAIENVQDSLFILRVIIYKMEQSETYSLAHSLRFRGVPLTDKTILVYSVRIGDDGKILETFFDDTDLKASVQELASAE